MLDLIKILEKSGIFKTLDVYERNDNEILANFSTKMINNEYTVDLEAVYGKLDRIVSDDFEIKLVKHYKDWGKLQINHK